MKPTISSKARITLGGALASALLLSASVSFADDTEVFFGGPSIDSGVRPNVLFILDNSGSMQWRTGSNNNPGAGEQSRMQILKESFSSIINNAGKINAGIMVLNSRSEYSNTRMAYPVTNIDEELPSSAAFIASTPLIIESGDDVVQSSLGGGAVINGSTLQMGFINTSTSIISTTRGVLANTSAFFQSRLASTDYACRMDEPGTDHRDDSSDACGSRNKANINIGPGADTNAGNPKTIIGTALLHFDSISPNIPAAAGLVSNFEAYIELRPTTNNSIPPTINVTMQDSKTPAAMNDLNPVDPGRSYLASSNILTTSWNTGTTSRINVTDLLKQVLDNDSDALQTAFFKLRATTTGEYIFCTQNCGLTNGVSNNPTLVITYNSTSVVSENKTVSLRFQNVGVPKGASITKATLSFAAATSNADPVTLSVHAEGSSDAAVFTSGSNLAARPAISSTSWSPDTWTTVSPATHTEGPNVTSLVQSVVDQSGWCGNNAMSFRLEPTAGTGSRTTFSVDGAPGLQPTLTISYTGGETGCINPIIEASVSSPKDDAFEANSNAMTLDGLTLPMDRSRFGARFVGLPIQKNAEIMTAQIVLTPANTVSIPTPFSNTVRFENTDNSAPYTATDGDITLRNDTTDSTCTISTWTTGTPVICKGTELKTGLQGIVNRAGWQPGNAISVMSVQSADTALEVQAFESNPAESIKLRVKIRHGGVTTSAITVRHQLNAIVQAMVSGSGTPLVPTYHEAAEYLKGERPGFASPITSACQPTHVVLLTDGQANGWTEDSRSEIAAWAGSCSTPVKSVIPLAATDSDSTDADERCGRTLAEWLAVTDQSPLESDSFINMHTIGFALDSLGTTGSIAPKKFLSDLASNGKGGTYNPSNASELSAAFSDILQTVQSVDTTFVSASAPVNSFERADNQDQLYFSLFRPKATNSWPGNLKRYRFTFFDNAGNLNPQIVDQDNVAAIDFTTGGFKTDARSFWSPSIDGNLTEAGGAAKQLPAAASRNLYTHISNASPSSATALSNLATGNSAITNAVLNAADDTAREAQFNYIRGLNADTTERKAIGDPIHSSPRLATYSCLTPNALDPAKCDVPDQTAFIGTNEGLLQAFNTQTGVELFGFMPQELLGNINKRMLDAQSTSLAPRPYGLDNPVTLWVNDLNDDGKVLSGSTPQAGEFVYAYASMGRGGRNIYAMDVTDRSSPKILWYIKGGVTPGFLKLGQTWSAPIKSKIMIGTTITDVLVFAGGYDELQDDASNTLVTNRTGDNMGNAIYVVNANTGSLIWSASNEASNASASQGHLQLAGMKYSIPANVRLIDLQMTDGNLVADENQLADQLFVGDTGGQVWRLYINNGQTGTGLITAGGTSGNGIFASAIPTNFDSLDAETKLKQQRRFYNTPEVALMKKNGQLSLSINIGSGYRGHPLKTETLDRFYSFRTSNLASPSGTEGTLREEDLLDLTANLSPTTDSAIATINGTQLKGGWFIPLTNSGEKVLTRALTTGTQQTIYFNTYQPSANTSSCTATFGTSRAYAVSLYDATAVDSITGLPVPRFNLLSSPGIPPQPEELCIGNNCAVIKGPGTDTGNTGIDIIDTPPPGPMYWIDDTGA